MGKQGLTTEDRRNENSGKNGKPNAENLNKEVRASAEKKKWISHYEKENTVERTYDIRKEYILKKSNWQMKWNIDYSALKEKMVGRYELKLNWG